MAADFRWGAPVRFHFTRLDLARTYLADGPDPMWELVNSLQMLQGGYGKGEFGPWQRQVTEHLRRGELTGQVRARLFPVAPDASYFPDLLTPAEAALGMDEGIDTVLNTPTRRLKLEIGRIAGAPGAGSWLADLSAGRATAMAALGASLRAYHRCAIAPYWTQLRARIDADLAARRQLAREGGVERLLESMRPMMRWRYPVLELTGHPSDRDVHLGGRGLLLVPSFFCLHHPVTLFDPELPQVVVYPVRRDPGTPAFEDTRPNDRALAALLGDTRASVLRATRVGRTTGELARRLGVSPASISHHTGILRDVGLITSRRTANMVQHILSPLGHDLLRGQV